MGMTTMDYLAVLSMTLIAYISANRRNIVRVLIPDRKENNLSGKRDG